MTKVGAQRAAELTGRSKSTIQRAMKGGKLSYEVDINGYRLIDMAELDRAFGLLPQGAVVSESSSSASDDVEQILETERLKMRIEMLEQQLEAALDKVEDLKMQRDQWQRQAAQVLITSQYSQKQAEELKEELKERERRARLRRQQELERRMAIVSQKPVQKGNVKTIRPAQPVSQQAAAAKAAMQAANETVRNVAGSVTKGFDVQSLWQKILGDGPAQKAAAPQAEETTEEEVQQQASA